MSSSRNRISRFLTDSRPHGDPIFHSLTNFYREEFVKCQRCLEEQREYYSERAISDVERALTRPEGLRTRPWYRSLIYVADENNGYANMVFPSINEAIRARDEALTGRELTDLVQRFDAATAALERARAALR